MDPWDSPSQGKDGRAPAHVCVRWWWGARGSVPALASGSCPSVHVSEESVSLASILCFGMRGGLQVWFYNAMDACLGGCVWLLAPGRTIENIRDWVPFPRLWLAMV